MTFKKEYLPESILKVLTPEPQSTKTLMKLTRWKRTTLMSTLQKLADDGEIERQVIDGMPGKTGYVYLWSKKEETRE